MIVDDEEGLGQELAGILESEGYEVVVASNGAQAKELIPKARLDLILLDLKLPDVWGLDLLVDIEASDMDTAVIVITGYGSVDSVRTAMKEGVYDYLTKPLDPEEVISAVKKTLLEQSKDQQRAMETNVLKKEANLFVEREKRIAELKQEIEHLKKQQQPQ